MYTEVHLLMGCTNKEFSPYVSTVSEISGLLGAVEVRNKEESNCSLV